MPETKWIVAFAVAAAVGLIVLLSRRPRRSMLVVVIISLQVGLALYLGDSSQYAQRWTGASGPSGIVIGWVTLAAVALLMVRAFSRDRLPFTWGGPVAVAASALLLSPALTIFFTPERSLAAFYVFEQAQFYVVFLAIVNGIVAWREARIVANLLSLTLATQSAVYILQNILGFSFTLTGEIETASGPLLRAGGTIAEHPAQYANFITPLLLMTIARLLVGRERRGRLWLTAAAGLGVAALILTFTRAAWSAFFVGFAVLIVMALAARRLRPTRFAFIAMIVAAAAVVLWPLIGIRSADSLVEAYQERFNLMRVAWNVIADNPVLGVGAGAYGHVFLDYVPADMPKGQWLFVVHNVYLLKWAEMGIVGVLSFLSIWAVALRQARSYRLAEDEALQTLRCGWPAAVAALLWQMNWDTHLGFQTSALFWTVVGLGASVRRSQQRQFALRMRTVAVPGMMSRSGRTVRRTVGLRGENEVLPVASMSRPPSVGPRERLQLRQRREPRDGAGPPPSMVRGLHADSSRQR